MVNQVALNKTELKSLIRIIINKKRIELNKSLEKIQIKKNIRMSNIELQDLKNFLLKVKSRISNYIGFSGNLELLTTGLVFIENSLVQIKLTPSEEKEAKVFSDKLIAINKKITKESRLQNDRCRKIYKKLMALKPSLVDVIYYDIEFERLKNKSEEIVNINEVITKAIEASI